MPADHGLPPAVRFPFSFFCDRARARRNRTSTVVEGGECVPEVDWSITPAAAAASAAARSAAASRAPGGVTTPLGCRTLHHGARAPGGVTTPLGSRTLHHGALALSSTDAGRQTTCCLVAYRLPPQSCVAPVVAWPTAPSPAASSGTPKLESPHGHTVSRKHPHLISAETRHECLGV